MKKRRRKKSQEKKINHKRRGVALEKKTKVIEEHIGGENNQIKIIGEKTEDILIKTDEVEDQKKEREKGIMRKGDMKEEDTAGKGEGDNLIM